MTTPSLTRSPMTTTHRHSARDGELDVTEHTVDEREAKLPGWARRELARLRADLADTQTRVRALTGVEGSPVAWNDPYADEPRPVALARDTIRFTPSGDPGERRSYLDARWLPSDGTGHAGYLEVRAAESLTIQPQASNVARVYITDWYGVPSGAR